MKRVEVITSSERRRRFAEDEKAQIVAESLAPGATVAATARRHDISPSLLYSWRKMFAGTTSDSDDVGSLDLAPRPGAFVRLIAPAPVSAPERRIVVHIAEQLVVDFPADASIEQITALVRALRA